MIELDWHRDEEVRRQVYIDKVLKSDWGKEARDWKDILPLERERAHQIRTGILNWDTEGLLHIHILERWWKLSEWSHMGDLKIEWNWSTSHSRDVALVLRSKV